MTTVKIARKICKNASLKRIRVKIVFKLEFVPCNVSVKKKEKLFIKSSLKAFTCVLVANLRQRDDDAALNKMSQ